MEIAGVPAPLVMLLAVELIPILPAVPDEYPVTVKAVAAVAAAIVPPVSEMTIGEVGVEAVLLSLTMPVDEAEATLIQLPTEYLDPRVKISVP
jgi:hypothetical protein